ncbi:MAG TPA: FtsX-like permease family protein, partial [Vicinamibacterales bacterium]|nr:FtsX-like permease family protein [Vicinamibacterales bacterium]
PSDYRHVSGPDVDVFVPYTIGTAGWTGRWLALYARIPPASTPGEAAHEISAVMAAIARTDRRSRGWHATVSTLHEMVVSDVRRTAWATFAASALLLAIACANVANLMLARGAVRTREFALRLALGASRARLARQVLIESAVVAAGGGVLGAMGAWLGVRALVVLAPPTVPRISEVALDPVAALFCAGLVAVTTAACGLVPAARLTRSLAVASGLGRAASHPARFGGLVSGLVMAEVAMAAAIVVAAGLLVRTVQVLNEQEYGFRRDAALSFRVNPPSSRWPGLDGTLAFYRTLREGLLAIPGVTAVGAGSDLPLAGQGAVASVTSEERVAAGLLEGVTVLQRRAGTGYFEALGTPLLAGRVFDDRDGPATPRVAVVSESLARTLFPGREAVGRRVALGGQPRDADWMTVIGVVADMRFAQADRVDDPQIYQAHVQSPSREMALVVRTGEVLGAVAAVKATLAAVDPGVPAYEITSLDGLVGRAIAGAEFTSWLFALFGLSALVLAAAGIYAVVAFAVGCRRRELGVRLALGATPGGVVRLVVGQGMRVVLAGLFLGLAGTIAGARVLEGLLYGVEATDAATYAVTAIILTAAGLGACYLPARQSVLPDPVHVLRAE